MGTSRSRFQMTGISQKPRPRFGGPAVKEGVTHCLPFWAFCPRARTEFTQSATFSPPVLTSPRHVLSHRGASTGQAAARRFVACRSRRCGEGVVKTHALTLRWESTLTGESVGCRWGP